MSLHSKEIYIAEVSFVPSGEGGGTGKPQEASAISFDLKLSTATFTFPEPLAKGTGTLKISFQCDINNQVRCRSVVGGKVKGSGWLFVGAGRRGENGQLQKKGARDRSTRERGREGGGGPLGEICMSLALLVLGYRLLPAPPLSATEDFVCNLGRPGLASQRTLLHGVVVVPFSSRWPGSTGRATPLSTASPA